MPLYSYECECGNDFEVVKKVSECDSKEKCPECGYTAKKVILNGHGGIWRMSDSLPWVRDAAKVLTEDDRPNPNINTVQDLRRYYKTHPNCRPKESHPAFPSSYGDALDRPDEKAIKAKRSRQAHEKLREMRSIKVTGQATA